MPTIDDDEMKRFNVWCAEEARKLRHRAAALGHPVEYEYLRNYSFILDRYKEVVPNWGTMNMESVLHAGCDDSCELDLAEINRIRKEWDEPALDFIPDVVGRMRFSPPKPKVPRPHDEQQARFYTWAREQVEHAYHVAEARGIDVHTALEGGSWLTARHIERHFPGLRVSWCLQTLSMSLAWTPRPAIDAAKVANIREWSQTIQETGDAIAKLAAKEPKSEHKN